MQKGPLVRALGCAVHIDASTLAEPDAAEIGRIWADANPACDDPSASIDLTVSARCDIPLRQALSGLSQQVTLAAIEARRGQLWMLHAAGVADEAGRVVALVGPSGQGKTTAARALAAHYGYVSDETIGIDAEGNVLPYRKPLSVIEDNAWVKTQRPPSELGLRPLPRAPLKLAGIVLLDRRMDGPVEPRVESCDLGEALSGLVAQTSYAGELSAPLRTIAGHAHAVGGVHRVSYREAATLRDALAPLFRDPGTTRVPNPVAESAPPNHQASGIIRDAYLDALALDDPDRVALLQVDPDGTTMFRIVDGIGPALWRAATGVPFEDLVVAAETSYGRPDGIDIVAAVFAALTELADQNVITTEQPKVIGTNYRLIKG